MTICNILDKVKNKHLDSAQFVSGQDSTWELHFPIMVKVITEQETKEYHLKKFASGVRYPRRVMTNVPLKESDTNV